MYRFIDFSTFLYGYERRLNLDDRGNIIVSFQNNNKTYYILSYLNSPIKVYYQDNTNLNFYSASSRLSPYGYINYSTPSSITLDKIESLSYELDESCLSFVRMGFVPKDYDRKEVLFIINKFNTRRISRIVLDQNWNFSFRDIGIFQLDDLILREAEQYLEFYEGLINVGKELRDLGL